MSTIYVKFKNLILSGNFIRAISFIAVFAFSSSIYGQNQSDRILELMNLINFSYVDSVDQKKITDAAIVAMLAELDPHSMYIPSDQVASMNESLNGSFEGIGVQFNMISDTVVVVSPISGGPAEKLGIISGDKIISAEGTIVSGMKKTDDEIISLLRGEKGTQVNMEVLKHGQTSTTKYLITRDKIPIYSVDASYMLNNETGYIKINRFALTTYDEFIAGMKKLQKQDMQNLVLDLRDNGGGFLYAAVKIVNEFLDGKKTIVSTKGLRQDEQLYTSDSKGCFKNGKLIVIINQGSASASEIVAGAIQDWDRGIILGRRSFGKGLVLNPYTLSDNSVIRLTTSRYFTPVGRSIQKDYSMSKKDYDNEINDRFENGEFISLESIELPDSLKFLTSSGRLVYGGGGILPDVFVPADTLIASDEFQNFLRSGAFSSFAISYAANNRSIILNLNSHVFSFVDSDVSDEEIFKKFENYIVQNEISEENISSELKEMCLRYIKSYIARNIWNNEGYYMSMNRNSNEISKSIELINNDELFWNDLSYKSE